MILRPKADARNVIFVWQEQLSGLLDEFRFRQPSCGRWHGSTEDSARRRQQQPALTTTTAAAEAAAAAAAAASKLQLQLLVY